MPEHRIKKSEVAPASEELLNLRGGSETEAVANASIKAEFLAGQKPAKKVIKTVGEDDSMRIRIIKASLFPSIYSK